MDRYVLQPFLLIDNYSRRHHNAESLCAISKETTHLHVSMLQREPDYNSSSEVVKLIEGQKI
jgi:hypothetical protein